MQSEKLDGFMREQQFRTAQGLATAAKRDDDAAKELLQMKSLSSSAYRMVA